MKRRIWAVLLSLFLVFVMVLPVKATSNTPKDADKNTEKDAEVKTIDTKGVFSYIHAGHLFSFLEIEDGLDCENILVNASGDGLAYKDNGKLARITERDATVHYLFILDNSGSMKSYSNRISDYMEGVADNQDLKVTYTIATFGERFDIVKEKMTDVETAKEALKNVSFDENYTDPYTALKSADTYLDGFSKSAGDIVSVILITDGEPCLKDPSKEDNLASMTEKVIAGFTDVVYSTVNLKDWTPVAKKSLTGGNGKDQEIRSNPDAKKLGGEMADYFDSFYSAEFELTSAPDKDFNYTLQISFAKDLKGNDVNVNNAEFSGIHPGKISDEKAEEPSAEEPTEGEPSVENPNSEKPSEIESAEPGSEGTSEKVPADEKEGLGGFIENHRIVIIIAAAVLLLLLIALIILIIVITGIVKKSKKKKAKKAAGAGKAAKTAEPVQAVGAEPIGATVAAPIAADSVIGSTAAPLSHTEQPGVFMRIEVYSGHCMNTSDTFSLTNAITIGSASQCDIIFADTDVAAVNTKIRYMNGQVFIEDQGTPNGTYLEGMRIPGRNRLRSGDIISIGSVEFAFKF